MVLIAWPLLESAVSREGTKPTECDPARLDREIDWEARIQAPRRPDVLRSKENSIPFWAHTSRPRTGGGGPPSGSRISQPTPVPVGHFSSSRTNGNLAGPRPDGDHTDSALGTLWRSGRR